MTQASQKAALSDDALITLTELVKGGRLDAVTAVPQWNVPVEPALFAGTQHCHLLCNKSYSLCFMLLAVCDVHACGKLRFSSLWLL